MAWSFVKFIIVKNLNKSYLCLGGIQNEKKFKYKKMVMNALLLAIGAILHQITPALGLPMQPDFALAMLFIIMIINDNDYKTSLICAIITGVFTALTTKFPVGQLPNIIDKIETVNVMFLVIIIINKISHLTKLNTKLEKNILVLLVFPIGTLVSGTTFLLSAKFIVGLPASFSLLFVTVVIPALVINTIGGFILYHAINVSLKRVLTV